MFIGEGDVKKKQKKITMVTKITPWIFVLVMILIAVLEMRTNFQISFCPQSTDWEEFHHFIPNVGLSDNN